MKRHHNNSQSVLKGKLSHFEELTGKDLSRYLNKIKSIGNTVSHV